MRISTLAVLSLMAAELAESQRMIGRAGNQASRVCKWLG